MAENVFAVTQSGGRGATDPQRIWVDSRTLKDRHVIEIVTRNSPGALCLVSAGRCLANNRVRILSADGQDLPNGHVGEILIQSDSLFTGYYNRPDLTAKAVQDGGYRSRDLVFALCR